MNDPYSILGISLESDDETIRKRYLQLVREFSPEQHPQRFAAIRAAYDEVKNFSRRVKARLFEQGKRDSMELIIAEIQSHSPRRRVGLAGLLDNLKVRS